MGMILMKYYKYINDEKGLMGKMELAKLTKVPSTLAATAPDDKATIELFKEAITKLTGKQAPVY